MKLGLLKNVYKYNQNDRVIKWPISKDKKNLRNLYYNYYRVSCPKF